MERKVMCTIIIENHEIVEVLNHKIRSLEITITRNEQSYIN